MVKRKTVTDSVLKADSDTDEPIWWTDVQATAASGVSFWRDFLDLRKGPNNDQILDTTDTARLLRIVRAVSWVESQHGHGSGTSAATDPMQCGNPADAWWREITGQSGNGDRIIRGPKLTSLWANQLKDAAKADPSFPAEAKLESLDKPVNGHNDPNFGRAMSFYWAIPYLIHRTNTTADDKTYQCGDLSDARLIEGAVAYNGGGDPDYREKIKHALALIGPAPFADRLDSAEMFAQAERLFDRFMISLCRETLQSKLSIFPHGLTSIRFSVEVPPLKLELDLSGPSSAA